MRQPKFDRIITELSQSIAAHNSKTSSAKHNIVLSDNKEEFSASVSIIFRPAGLHFINDPVVYKLYWDMYSTYITDLKLNFIHKPDNRHDPYAISISTSFFPDIHIGYVPAAINKHVLAFDTPYTGQIETLVPPHQGMDVFKQSYPNLDDYIVRARLSLSVPITASTRFGKIE
jgi:hypothetical protein